MKDPGKLDVRDMLAAGLLLSLALGSSLQAMQPLAVQANNKCFASGGGYCTDSGCLLEGGMCVPRTTGCPCEF